MLKRGGIFANAKYPKVTLGNDFFVKTSSKKTLLELLFLLIFLENYFGCIPVLTMPIKLYDIIYIYIIRYRCFPICFRIGMYLNMYFPLVGLELLGIKSC